MIRKQKNVSFFILNIFYFRLKSDKEQETCCSDDKSNVTTDDEFYNELMDAPAEYDDHLSKKKKSY